MTPNPVKTPPHIAPHPGHTAPPGIPAATDHAGVCPEHLRFAPCRRCRTREPWVSTAPRDVALALAFQRGAHPSCSSHGHDSFPASVEGLLRPQDRPDTYSPTRPAGDPDERTAAFCTKCAVILELSGRFTPTRALRGLEGHVIARGYDPATWRRLRAANLRTCELLTNAAAHDVPGVG